jgi:hypothetical protein
MQDKPTAQYQPARWFQPSNALLERIRAGIDASLQSIGDEHSEKADLLERSALLDFQELNQKEFSNFVADQAQSLVDAIAVASRARRLRTYLFGTNVSATAEFAEDAKANMPFAAFERDETADVLFCDLARSVSERGTVAVRGGKLRVDHDALLLAVEEAPSYPDTRQPLKYSTKVSSLKRTDY